MGSTMPSPAAGTPVSVSRLWAEVSLAQRGLWADEEWKGWWRDPPFHTPVFVLTHYTRSSIEMAGGRRSTSSIRARPRPSGLLRTRPACLTSASVEALPPSDNSCCQPLDYMHIVIVPIVLGRGERLWDGLEAFEQLRRGVRRSPSGVTHLIFTRREAGADRSPSSRGVTALLGRSPQPTTALVLRSLGAELPISYDRVRFATGRYKSFFPFLPNDCNHRPLPRRAWADRDERVSAGP